MNFSILYKMFFVSVVFLGFSFAGSAQNANEQQTTVTPVTVKTIKIKVTGITCSGDCKDIQKEVSKIPGVVEFKQVGKPSATSVFEINFDPATVSEKDIRKAVESTPGCKNPDDRPYKVKQG